MDFEQVLTTVLGAFERQHIRYAVIGGFALTTLGVLRATRDVDFLVHRDDLEPLHAILTPLGYQRVAQTENVSHYTHPDLRWGSLDFIHAFRAIACEMLEQAQPRPIFQGKQTIRVVHPEDVIGLKVQSLANNPRRRAKDQYDIEELAKLYGNRLNWSRIQDHYELFDLGAEGKELRARFEHVE